MVKFPPVRQLFEKSMDKLKRDAARALAFDHLSSDARPPMTLYSFNSALPPVSGPSDMSKGSDIDIGGFTDSTFTMVPSSASTFTPPPTTSPGSTSGEEVAAGPSMSHLAFHGKMSLVIPRGQEGKIRPGYAGMRNRRRLHLFGEDMWDLSRYSHLKLVLAYRGWEGWRNRWYCNVQVDGTQVTDLFQHRIEFLPSPTSTPSIAPLDLTSPPEPQFTTFHLPLSSFVLTNHGYTAAMQEGMTKGRVRSVGFALLGGGRGEENIIPVSGTPTQSQVAELRRRAGAGFGKGGGAEAPDAFVEAMLAEDGIQIKGSTAASDRPDPVRAAGYQRAGQGGQVEEDPVEEAEPEREYTPRRSGLGGLSSVKVTPWSEGYYELCVKSVEAVNYDPMAADGGAEDEDM